MITNYTLQEFLKKDEETISSYSLILKCLKPKNSFTAPQYSFNGYKKKIYKVTSVWDLSFSTVEKTKSHLNKNELVDAVCVAYGIDKWQVMYMKIVDFFSVVNFIKDEVLNILKTESARFSLKPDPKMILAGVDELNVFGALNVVDSLANDKIINWKDVEKLPYREVHTKIWKNTVSSRINKAYYSQ